MYRIDVCKSINELAIKEEEWKTLEQKSNNQNITASYEWIYTFLTTFLSREDNQFGFNKKLFILFLYKDDTLTAIFPLIKLDRKKYGVKATFVEFIGQQWAATFLDILGSNLSKEDINHLFEYIYRNEKFDVLQLKYIPHRTLNFTVTSSDFTLLSACPYIDLTKFNDLDDFKEKVYSKNLRRNFTKAENKMIKQGYNLESSSSNINGDNFNEIISVSKRKLEDGKHSIYLDNDKKQFVQNIINSINSNVTLCYLNEKISAYRLNFFYGNYKYSFDASYERDFKKFELGSHSIEASIKDSVDKGIYIHSEGTGIDSYKMKFMQGIEKIYTYTKKGNKIGSMVFFTREMKKAKLIEENFNNQLSGLK